MVGAPPATQPAIGPRDGRIVTYAPRVRIDWARSIVELDGRVVLRRGPLELFACSPRTREHESIVVVNARPLHAFQALGLVGLEPGSPCQFDPSTRQYWPARGAALRVDVAVGQGGKEVVAGVHRWMRRAGGDAPLGRVDWVFAGSRTLPGDRFAADQEGTVIAVVDFDSALVALPESHTSDDGALWLEAHTDAIPPIGTPCVIRISGADRGRTVIEVTGEGALRMGGRLVSAADIRDHLRAERRRDPGAHVLLVPNGDPARAQAAKVRETLTQDGCEVLIRSKKPKRPSPRTAPSGPVR